MKPADSDRPVGGFAVPLLSDDANLRDALCTIALLGQHAVPTCVGASITLITGQRATTGGSCNTVADELDAVQYATGTGPCLTAAREDRQIQIDDTRRDKRWPEFNRACELVGVRSVLAHPLVANDDQLRGGFNAYGSEPDAFEAVDVELSAAFASQATAVVRNAWVYWRADDTAKNLPLALESRAVIEQAKGMLMLTLDLDADEAFEELCRRSQHQNRKLRVVAADLIAETTSARSGQRAGLMS